MKVTKEKNYISMWKDNINIEILKYPKGKREIIIDDLSGKKRKISSIVLSRREAGMLKKVI